MKTLLTLITLMSYCQLAYSQVGIGNNVNSFDDSEILKIEASNKGVLLRISIKTWGLSKNFRQSEEKERFISHPTKL